MEKQDLTPYGTINPHKLYGHVGYAMKGYEFTHLPTPPRHEDYGLTPRAPYQYQYESSYGSWFQDKHQHQHAGQSYTSLKKAGQRSAFSSSVHSSSLQDVQSNSFYTLAAPTELHDLPPSRHLFSPTLKETRPYNRRPSVEQAIKEVAIMDDWLAEWNAEEVFNDQPTQFNMLLQEPTNIDLAKHEKKVGRVDLNFYGDDDEAPLGARLKSIAHKEKRERAKPQYLSNT